MATTFPSAALVPVTPVFSTAERLAFVGFMAGYSGLTRQAYELDCASTPAVPHPPPASVWRQARGY